MPESIHYKFYTFLNLYLEECKDQKQNTNTQILRVENMVNIMIWKTHLVNTVHQLWLLNHVFTHQNQHVLPDYTYNKN